MDCKPPKYRHSSSIRIARAPDYQTIVEKLIINESKNYLIYLFKRFQSMLEEKCYAIQKVLLLQFTCFIIISPSRMSPSLKSEPQGGTMKKRDRIQAEADSESKHVIHQVRQRELVREWQYTLFAVMIWEAKLM